MWPGCDWLTDGLVWRKKLRNMYDPYVSISTPLCDPIEIHLWHILWLIRCMFHVWPVFEPSITHIRHIYDPFVIDTRTICDKSAIRLRRLFCDISVTHPWVVCNSPVTVYDSSEIILLPICNSFHDSYVTMWPISDHDLSETYLWSIWDPSTTHQ